MLYQKNITMSKAHVLKRYSFLIWILFFVLSTKAEQQDYYFRQISLEQGLSQSRVQCIYRDHLGVIWIGTKWGLNSYDQSELKSYFHDREQPNSLPDNFIRFITEDRLGDLYVSTNKGIAIYNKAENQFQPLKYNGKPFNAWSYLQIGDNFLFGGEETLYQYNLTDKNITTIFPDIDGDKLKCINRIFQWSPDVLITSSKKDGLWMYDLTKKKMYRCPFVKEREINTIFVDSQNRLWVSFYGKGIACYSKEGKRLFSLSVSPHLLHVHIHRDGLGQHAAQKRVRAVDVCRKPHPYPHTFYRHHAVIVLRVPNVDIRCRHVHPRTFQKRREPLFQNRRALFRVALRYRRFGFARFGQVKIKRGPALQL